MGEWQFPEERPVAWLSYPLIFWFVSRIVLPELLEIFFLEVRAHCLEKLWDRRRGVASSSPTKLMEMPQ